MRARVLKALVIALIVLMNIGCDQATKHVARARLADRGTVSVVGNVFILHLRGKRRGVPQPGGGLSPAASHRCVHRLSARGPCRHGPLIVRRRPGEWALVAGLAFIAGGGFGNLIDRLTRAGQGE